MEYRYTARNARGVSSSGVIAAESLENARSVLKDDGLFVLSLAAQSVAAISSKATARGLSFPRVSKSEVLMLTSQLSIMTQAGVDLAEALELGAQECTHATLKPILQQIHADVSAGVPVSESMQKHSDIFGEAYVASIAAGEASGTLAAVLTRLVELLQHEIRLMSTLRGALAYPVVLLGVASVVVSALIFFVLPQFGKVFADLGQPPPFFTQMLLNVSLFLRSNILIIATGFGIAGTAGWKLRSRIHVGHRWDSFLLNSRMVRASTRALLTGRALRLLGTMLQSGIPLVEGIRLCRSSVRNSLFRDLFDAMERNVLTGGNIGDILKSCDFIPGGASQMVSTAERTGRLGPVMVTVGEFYEEDGETRIRDLTRLLEPLIIVVMGVIVAGVVMSVMLPLLDASTAPSHG